MVSGSVSDRLIASGNKGRLSEYFGFRYGNDITTSKCWLKCPEIYKLIHCNSPYAIKITIILLHFFREHPGEPVPEENFWTLWCKGRFTEANTPTIWLGATPSRLTSAHFHIALSLSTAQQNSSVINCQFGSDTVYRRRSSSIAETAQRTIC